MMSGVAPFLAVHGLLLPSSMIDTPAFAVLAAFVAINTIMYTALAIAKMLPKIYITDYDPRRFRRAETRSIHPDASGNGQSGN